jgi:3-oxoacyl-[acyl-carrier-protein] synthase II
VTAPKSYFGNAGAGGAMLELAASVVAMEHGVIPPTVNYETPDPACPVAVVHGAARIASAAPIVKLAAARTGQTAAAVLLPPG